MRYNRDTRNRRPAIEKLWPFKTPVQADLERLGLRPMTKEEIVLLAKFFISTANEQQPITPLLVETDIPAEELGMCIPKGTVSQNSAPKYSGKPFLLVASDDYAMGFSQNPDVTVLRKPTFQDANGSSQDRVPRDSRENPNVFVLPAGVTIESILEYRFNQYALNSTAIWLTFFSVKNGSRANVLEFSTFAGTMLTIAGTNFLISDQSLIGLGAIGTISLTGAGLLQLIQSHYSSFERAIAVMSLNNSTLATALLDYENRRSTLQNAPEILEGVITKLSNELKNNKTEAETKERIKTVLPSLQKLKDNSAKLAAFSESSDLGSIFRLTNIFNRVVETVESDLLPPEYGVRVGATKAADAIIQACKDIIQSVNTPGHAPESGNPGLNL